MDVPQTPCICCLPFVCADDPFQHSMHAHDPVVFTSIAPSTPCIGDLACGIRIPALQHFLHLQLAKVSVILHLQLAKVSVREDQ